MFWKRKKKAKGSNPNQTRWPRFSKACEIYEHDHNLEGLRRKYVYAEHGITCEWLSNAGTVRGTLVIDAKSNIFEGTYHLYLEHNEPLSSLYSGEESDQTVLASVF